MQKSFVALSCILAVATASPLNYYRYASPYYNVGYSVGAPVSYTSPIAYAAPTAVAAPVVAAPVNYASPSEAASASFLQGFSGNTDLSSLGPLSEDSVALIKAGVP